MIIYPCNYTSRLFQPHALDINKAILQDTTPEDFDKTLTEYPEYSLSFGGFAGENALGVAAIHGNTSLIHHIVQKGGKHLLDLGSDCGWTPLFFAASCEDHEKGFLAAKALLFLGSGINLSTSCRWYDTLGTVIPDRATPLWAAAVKTQNLKLVKLLLIYGGAIHPDTAGEFFDCLTKERRIPLTLINQAKEDLKKETEKLAAFNIYNHLSTENKLPKDVLLLIGHYFREEMTIPNLKPRPLRASLHWDLFKQIDNWVPFKKMTCLIS